MRTVNIDGFSVIIFLGLVQGIFLSSLLLAKSEAFNKILAIILLLISVQISDFFFAYSRISLTYPHLIDISVPLGLAIGPLIYMFYFFIAEKKYPQRMFLHFIPFIVFTINQSFYYLQSASFKYNSFIRSRGLDLQMRTTEEGFISDPMALRNLGGLLTAASLFIYIILVFIELLKIFKQSKVNFMKPGKQAFIWIRNFAMLTMLLVLFVVINQLLGGEPESEYLVGTGLTIIIYYSSYQFTRHSFQPNELLPVVKYEKSALPEEMKRLIKEKLISHMENDKPYLNNLFSLNQLSVNIQSTQNHVSRIINEEFNQSYYDFVSCYRIHEACNYLVDPAYKTRTIEEISFLVGYNSKAAFNKAFKKNTGTTPLQYKKNPEMYSPSRKHLFTCKKSNADTDLKSLDH